MHSRIACWACTRVAKRPLSTSSVFDVPQERFDAGVTVTLAFATHRRLNLELFEQLLVIVGTILAPPVGVLVQSGGRTVCACRSCPCNSGQANTVRLMTPHDA